MSLNILNTACSQDLDKIKTEWVFYSVKAFAEIPLFFAFMELLGSCIFVREVSLLPAYETFEYLESKLSLSRYVYMLDGTTCYSFYLQNLLVLRSKLSS